MNKIETAAQREEKVRHLARKIQERCSDFCGRLTDHQRQVLLLKLEALDAALNAFREYDTPWDSQLIKVARKVGGVAVQTEAFSTFDSVMDHARDAFAYLVIPE